MSPIVWLGCFWPDADVHAVQLADFGCRFWATMRNDCFAAVAGRRMANLEGRVPATEQPLGPRDEDCRS